MKTTILSILAAAAAISFASAQTAYTTPVGYYTIDGKAGGNLVVPSFVNSAVFSGAITGSTSTTLSVATGSLTANALDAAGVFATHYVEITEAGDNQGVVVDIASNTDGEVTLASDISALSLAGTEKIVIRPHVTLKSALAGGEASYAAFADSVTFYNADGSITAYFYDGSGNWTSDFVNPDGNARPITPGTGFVLGLSADTAVTVTGEVKSSPVVVQLTGGVVNIVGPVYPVVGASAPISSLGFQNMVAFADSVTLYTPGTLGVNGAYFADGAGNVTSDFFSASTDEFPYTTGGVVTASGDTSLRIGNTAQ